jgi:hypothetical protein
MFNFLKKAKPRNVFEITEPKQALKSSVRERAIEVFSAIEGR